MPSSFPESDSLTPYTHMDPEKHFIGESLPPPSRVVSSGIATVGSSPMPAREDHFHGGSGGGVGDIFMRGTSAAVAGALLLNGAAVSRTTYAELFALWGTTFGVGDGSTTFNVMDMRDRFPVGAGNLYGANASGGSANAIVVSHGHTININSGTVSADHSHAVNINTGNELQGHTHNIPEFGTLGSSYGGVDGQTSNQNTITTGSENQLHQHNVSGNTGGISANHVHNVSGSTSTDGVSGTNANLPPYRGMYFFVYTGV